MTIPPKHLPAIALFVFPALALAGIDSGGGISSAGAIHNRSSIGDSFVTLATRAGTTYNHPGLIETIYPLTPSSVTDIDQNDLDDSWEVLHFGSIGVDPVADADHDGTSNLMEYLAATDPNNPSSAFRPQGSYTGRVFQMPIPTVSGRIYQIRVSNNLQNWTLQTTLIGDGSQQFFEFDEATITSGPLHGSTHPSSYFFQIQILIP